MQTLPSAYMVVLGRQTGPVRPIRIKEKRPMADRERRMTPPFGAFLFQALV